MNIDEFREWGYKVTDMMADYYQQIETFPVKSAVVPGEIINKLPQEPPAMGESMNAILQDFSSLIIPGIAHWQSPSFFAYFPANASFPSILAEMLTASLGAQCMVWETSPAAAELEERMMDWLKQMTGLPANWHGVIQDTASTSTLVALLSAREEASGFVTNTKGLNTERYRVYCSTETHSSVEKAIKIAGIGSENLIKVETDSSFRLDPQLLEVAINKDLKDGFTPLCVVATLGTTGCTAIDPVSDMATLCNKFGIWLHVDAAYAGTALLLPEYRYIIEGIERADSFVFNPHKWMFTNFDCSAYFIKDREALLRTFEILPEYLKTPTRGMVNDYRDWGVQLGRRFRALKLWFVIRSFGTDKLSEMIRNHIALAQWFRQQVEWHPHFELMAPVTFSVVCFRFKPEKLEDDEQLNALNAQLLNKINASGKVYLSHTRLHNKFTLRLSVAGTLTGKEHVDKAWFLIQEIAAQSGDSV